MKDMDYPQQLINIIQTSVPQLNQIDEEKYNHRATPHSWSKKEILGHLVDSAYCNHQRFLTASAQDNLVFRGYDQDAWVELNNYKDRDTKDLISLWQSVNQHLAELLDNIPPDVIKRVSTKHNYHKICMNKMSSETSTSLSYLIWDYLFHVEHHLSQLIDGFERSIETTFH